MAASSCSYTQPSLLGSIAAPGAPGSVDLMQSFLEQSPKKLNLTIEDFKSFSTHYLSQKDHLPTDSYYYCKERDLPVSFACHIQDSEKTIYLLSHTLQSGQNGLTQLGISLHGRVVVIKLIPENALGEDELEIYQHFSEIEMASQHFIYGPTFKCLMISQNHLSMKNTIGLILPYKSGGDLLEYVNTFFEKGKGLPTKHIYSIAKQMSEALAYLHEHNIVHLDAKTENFLVEFEEGKPTIFLADFGHATFDGSLIETTKKGAPGYRDPEWFTKPPCKTREASFPSDIWSLGITLSILKNGSSFQEWTEQMDGNYDKLSDMSESAFSYYKTVYFPNAGNKKSLERVISRCLELDPKSRISAKKAAEKIDQLILQRRWRSKRTR